MKNKMLFLVLYLLLMLSLYIHFTYQDESFFADTFYIIQRLNFDKFAFYIFVLGFLLYGYLLITSKGNKIELYGLIVFPILTWTGLYIRQIKFYGQLPVIVTIMYLFAILLSGLGVSITYSNKNKYITSISIILNITLYVIMVSTFYAQAGILPIV